MSDVTWVRYEKGNYPFDPALGEESSPPAGNLVWADGLKKNRTPGEGTRVFGFFFGPPVRGQYFSCPGAPVLFLGGRSLYTKNKK